MSCIEGHFRAMVPELESRLRPYLTGFFGGIVRGYLPQRWVFSTEEEDVTLKVDEIGKVTVSPGPDSKPDVTVRTSHAKLEAALRTRRRQAVPPGALEVIPHTAKGRTAFDYLRSQIGL